MVRGPRYQPSQYARYRSSQFQGYPMEGYPPPPPAYNAADAPPPVYQPPEGASKAMADQNISAVHPQLEPRSYNNIGVSASSATVAAPDAAARR